MSTKNGSSRQNDVARRFGFACVVEPLGGGLSAVVAASVEEDADSEEDGASRSVKSV
jgi:hypothetical protein